MATGKALKQGLWFVNGKRARKKKKRGEEGIGTGDLRNI